MESWGYQKVFENIHSYVLWNYRKVKQYLTIQTWSLSVPFDVSMSNGGIPTQALVSNLSSAWLRSMRLTTLLSSVNLVPQRLQSKSHNNCICHRYSKKCIPNLRTEGKDISWNWLFPLPHKILWLRTFCTSNTGCQVQDSSQELSPTWLRTCSDPLPVHKFSRSGCTFHDYVLDHDKRNIQVPLNFWSLKAWREWWEESVEKTFRKRHLLQHLKNDEWSPLFHSI